MMPNKELKPLQLPESVVLIEVNFYAERQSTHLFSAVDVCGIFLFHVKSCSQVRCPQAGKPESFSCNPYVTERDTTA